MSGATNCPETPRQKMIGMMYLVLTAMLALNVSADILNGFNMVDESLLKNIKTSELRNDNLHGDMEYLYEQNKEKVREWKLKADIVKMKSDSLCDLLQNVKKEIVAIADAEKADTTGNKVIKRDNIDVAAQWAGLSTGGENGMKIKKAIEAYRDFAISMFPNDTTKKGIYNELFFTEDRVNQLGENVDWLNATFHNMPVIAVMTMMSKYQNDVRATEAEIINYFKAQTDASDFRVNKITAKLIPVSKHIMQGGSYQAEIALMAIDSTKAPIYYLGKNKLDSSAVNIRCGSIGTFPIEGRIDLINGQGQTVSYPFSDEYTVGAPSATIANIDMNVVYKGYANRMEVSVPGVASDKLSVSCTGGTITRDGKNYICKPTANNTIKINVFAEIEGKRQSMGSGEFRVRILPDPVAFLKITDNSGNPRNYRPGGQYKAKRKEIMNATMVAEYPDGLLKAKFTIKSFTMLVSDGRGGFSTSVSSGNKFSPQQKNLLGRIKAGSRVLFENIKVTGAKSANLSYPNIVLN